MARKYERAYFSARHILVCAGNRLNAVALPSADWDESHAGVMRHKTLENSVIFDEFAENIDVYYNYSRKRF